MPVTTYTVGPAQPEHLSILAEVERAAARLFPAGLLPPHTRDRVLAAATLAAAQAEGRLWVAVDGRGCPVGFALVQAVGETAILVEVDVHPDHGRQGLGRALVGAVVAWARAEGFPSIALTTFEHLPWNAPFYERLGFRRLSNAELPLALAQMLDAEAQDGLTRRVAMQLDLRAA